MNWRETNIDFQVKDNHRDLLKDIWLQSQSDTHYEFTDSLAELNYLSEKLDEIYNSMNSLIIDIKLNGSVNEKKHLHDNKIDLTIESMRDYSNIFKNTNWK